MNPKILLILGIFFVLVVSGCITPSGNVISERGDTTNVKKDWHKVTEFTGRNNKVTDSFYIKGNKWRFTWECEEDTSFGTGFGAMNVFAIPESTGNTLIGESIFMGKCEGSDTSYVYEGPGSYYFDIDAANVLVWRVLVEDYYG